MLFRNLICIAVLLVGTAGIAQTGLRQNAADSQDDDQASMPQRLLQTPLEINRAGRTAGSSAGQVGERQSRDAEAVRVGVRPIGRIAGRIQSRVQNRIRNRIDRNYDPQSNAADPFAVAEDQTRTSGRVR